MKPITFTGRVKIIGTKCGGRHYTCGTSYATKLTIVEETNHDRVCEIDIPLDSALELCGARVEVTVRILAPSKKVTPWTLDTVPFGAWFRLIGQSDALDIASAANMVGLTLSKGLISYADVAQRYEYTIDCGKTWSPAGKVEEVYE